MEAVTGVFKTRADAQHALQEVYKTGVTGERATLLTPGSADEIAHDVESIPVDTTEQPGMGKVIGALAGGGVGITGGSLLITLVPGLGPVSAIGLLGAALLGAAGATVGALVGGKAEESVTQGLPEDEIFVYEDALRKGRSVVFALAEDEGEAERLRKLLNIEGAESVDAAREQWWIGLRSAEQEHYSKSGRNFQNDEMFFRMGFQAALHAKNRCREFDQVSAEMTAQLEDVQRKYPGADVEEPFTRGYERGRDYYQRLCDEGKAA
jgi:hypothetical protein